MFDVIIVGSGPSGTFAAKSLKEKKVLILDVGHTPQETHPLNENLLNLKKELLARNHYKLLHNIFHDYKNPKLKSPFFSFVTQTHHPFQEETPQFNLVLSYAQGGLANAWGAGAYRFNQQELKDFPYTYEELAPYYDEVESEIGISGLHGDDLHAYFGESKLLGGEPLEKSPVVEELYQQYLKHKGKFIDDRLKLGHLRMAILNRDFNQRKAHDYQGLEFHRPFVTSVYNPRFTLDKLIKEHHQNIFYQSGRYATSFSETKDGIQVVCQNLLENKEEVYTAKKLILSAGTVESSRLVLNSIDKDQSTAKLNFEENVISYIPFLCLKRIGQPASSKIYPPSLGLTFHDKENRELLGTIYGLEGPLSSDFLMDFPLSIRGNLLANRYLVPAMLIIQLFYPGKTSKQNVLSFDKANNRLRIQYVPNERGESEKEIIKRFRRLGFFSHSLLCKKLPPGNSFHYACTLPMKFQSGPLETDAYGKLFGHDHVYLSDASSFSSLPSKNHTLTIMAHSSRIAHHLAQQL